MKTLLLTKEEVSCLISIDDTIAAVEEGYRNFNGGQVIQPDYIGIPIPNTSGEIDFKAGYCNGTVSMKASSGGLNDNPEKYGLPPGMGEVLLYDADSCALLCIMDGTLITGYRTGAAGAVSVKVLARKDAHCLVSVGTGNQARMQARAISRVMDINEIYAWDEVPDAVYRFKQDMEKELGILVTVTKTKREAVERADVLVTTTRGRGSVIESAWVKAGTHIVAVGTDQRGKQEFDPEIFRNAKIINDSIEQCIVKGETQHAINGGIITKEQIHAEIGEILLGIKAGRENDDEITIFDTTGMAVQDNVTADIIYKRAIENNIGTYFEFFK